MPELPEVETIRRDLETVLVGRRIDRVAVDGRRTVRRQPVSQFVAAVAGRTVTGTRRLGKFLAVDLEDVATLMVHLRMSGQLLWTPDPAIAAAKHTHARFVLSEGEELRFVDPRTFGELWVTTADLPELSHIGPDAFNDLPESSGLASRMVGRRSGLKVLLLNQAVIAGIGNIYSDEILFEAGLRNDRLPSTLTAADWERLHGAIGSVLADGVANRGTSMVDEQYKDIFGNLGQAQNHHKVFNRAGQPCVRCTAPIVRTKVQGRSSYYCPGCQR